MSRESVRDLLRGTGDFAGDLLLGRLPPRDPLSRGFGARHIRWMVHDLKERTMHWKAGLGQRQKASIAKPMTSEVEAIPWQTSSSKDFG